MGKEQGSRDTCSHNKAPGFVPGGRREQEGREAGGAESQARRPLAPSPRRGGEATTWRLTSRISKRSPGTFLTTRSPVA